MALLADDPKPFLEVQTQTAIRVTVYIQGEKLVLTGKMLERVLANIPEEAWRDAVAQAWGI